MYDPETEWNIPKNAIFVTLIFYIQCDNFYLASVIRAIRKETLDHECKICNQYVLWTYLRIVYIINQQLQA